jgi:hypothetical protein
LEANRLPEKFQRALNFLFHFCKTRVPLDNFPIVPMTHGSLLDDRQWVVCSVFRKASVSGGKEVKSDVPGFKVKIVVAEIDA